ncbi:MAG: BamA/TamA family outer membrane protein [Planctomycetota bacterium]
MIGTAALTLPLVAALVVQDQDEPLAQILAAESSFWDRFKDPTDGRFDVTSFLSSGGFIPVPFIITEPAIGFGGGAALLFIHDRNPDDPWYENEESAREAPPTGSAVFGAGTENGTWLAGGAHQGIWRGDTIRYVGALATGRINLDLFVDNTPFAYGLETVFLYQDIRFRLGNSDAFLGLTYRFSDSEASFRDLPPELFPALQQNDAGAGVVAQWDTRDNVFTPRSGQDAELEAVFWNEAVGGDSNFASVEGKVRHYMPVSMDHTLGVRVTAAAAEDDAPFYLLPSVSLRGVPFARYQGTSVLSSEAEFRYAFDPRWEGLLFGGVGASWDDVLADSGAVFAGGLGFRYLLSRPFGISGGLDFAVGPEQGVVYVAVGSGL